MKFEILRGTASGFDTASQQVLDIYNADSDWFPEKLEIKHPENIFLIRPKGVAGGLIVDIYNSHPNIADVMFAGFEEQDRRKGYLKACLAKANQYLSKKGSKIVSVSLNPHDEYEAWQKVGFTFEYMVNMVPRLFNAEPSQFFDISEHRSEGLSMQDVLQTLGYNSIEEWINATSEDGEE